MRSPLPCRPVGWFVGGLLLACLALGCGKPAAPPEDEHHPAPVKAVAVRAVKLGQWTELLGTTQPLPDRVARVSAAVEGHVHSVLGDGHGPAVAEGQRVSAGQVIAQLDDLEEWKKQAGFAVELAEIEVKRLAELARNVVTGSTPLVSRVEIEKAGIVLKEARSKQQGVAAKETAIRAELKALDAQLAFYTLRAPIAGALGMLHVVAGQTLTPGTTVAEVVNLDEIDVLCYAPPDAAARLALDQPAKLLVQEAASPETQEPLVGKVAFIAVQSDPQTGNVPVKVRFPNPERRLRAYMIVRVNVLTRPENERLTIPEAALMEDSDIPTVVVVQDVKTEKKGEEEEKVGKARKLQVLVGIRDRQQRVAEVLGLEDPATKEKVALTGMLFVTSGGYGLQNDDLVKLANEDPKEAK